MQRTWEPPIRYIVLAVLIVLFVALVWYIRSLLQPLLTAGLIAFVLSPGATFVMKRFRVGRRVAATLVYFATLAVLLIVVSTVVPAMLDQFDSVRADLQSGLTDLQAVLATPVQFGVFRVDLRLLGPSLTALLYRGPIVPQPSQAIRFLEMTSRGVVWTVVVMVTVYYLMTEWDQLRDWVIHLAPPSERGDLTRLYMQIRTVWGQYLGGQVRLIAILAVIYAVAWQIIGLPGALVLGLLAGFLNLVPEVGPAAVGILATVVGSLEGSRVFVSMPPLWFAALTLGVYLLINTFKSVWLQPRILGRSVLLHEGLVFVAIVAALVLNGILGVLIVVPLLASAIIVGKYLRRRLLGLSPFDDLPEEQPLAGAAPAHAELVAPALPKKNSQ
ncbi:MAG: AI-2E family transporter [Anaerolineales bacterium]